MFSGKVSQKQAKGSFMDTNSKKYRTILADLPWDINQRGNYGAIKHYNLMSLDRIKAMPVADLAATDGQLYLWTPNSLIPEALEVIKAWGFRYRCSIVWCKPRILLGRYVRTAHETLLMATCGHAPVKFHAQPSWVFAPQQEHSHKPEEVYPIIERLFDGPYLELFARRRQPGWDAWGDEIDSDIVIPGYPVPTYSPKVTNTHAKRKEM